jgi:hypothetical protein
MPRVGCAIRRAIVVGVTLALATAVPAQQHPYYPLHRGATWTYRVPRSRTQVFTRTVVEAKEASHIYTVEATTHLTALGEEDTGIYRYEVSGDVVEVGHGAASTPVAEMAGSHSVVLKETLAKGMRWKCDGDCEVVDFITLAVPAGEYTNVAKILVRKGAFAEVHYYAPDVGLVKIDLIHDDGPPTFLIELVSYASGRRTASGAAEQNDDQGATFPQGPDATRVRRIRPLAERGDATAQVSLGAMYKSGHGVPQDYEEAMKWCRKAAAQGNTDAQGLIGLMYKDGNGVEQDFVRAATWLRKAADKGHAGAQAALAFLYIDGNGVPQDYVQAYKWLNLACAGSKKGDDAFEARDIVAARMSPAQLAEAQKQSRNWKPK